MGTKRPPVGQIRTQQDSHRPVEFVVVVASALLADTLPPTPTRVPCLTDWTV